MFDCRCSLQIISGTGDHRRDSFFDVVMLLRLFIRTTFKLCCRRLLVMMTCMMLLLAVKIIRTFTFTGSTHALLIVRGGHEICSVSIIHIVRTWIRTTASATTVMIGGGGRVISGRGTSSLRWMRRPTSCLIHITIGRGHRIHRWGASTSHAATFSLNHSRVVNHTWGERVVRMMLTLVISRYLHIRGRLLLVHGIHGIICTTATIPCRITTMHITRFGTIWFNRVSPHRHLLTLQMVMGLLLLLLLLLLCNIISVIIWEHHWRAVARRRCRVSGGCGIICISSGVSAAKIIGVPHRYTVGTSTTIATILTVILVHSVTSSDITTGTITVMMMNVMLLVRIVMVLLLMMVVGVLTRLICIIKSVKILSTRWPMASLLTIFTTNTVTR